MRFTVDTLADLYRQNRYARYVAVFQNWLRPAGASFDHLHKQLVAIDQHGTQAAGEVERLRSNPNIYNDLLLGTAVQHNLVIAENDSAIVFAGFGHRYPTLEIYSKSATCEPGTSPTRNSTTCRRWSMRATRPPGWMFRPMRNGTTAPPTWTCPCHGAST